MVITSAAIASASELPRRRAYAVTAPRWAKTLRKRASGVPVDCTPIPLSVLTSLVRYRESGRPGEEAAAEVVRDPIAVEREHGELGWRPADEAVQEHEVLRLARGRGLVEAGARSAERDPCHDLEPRAGARRQRADCAHHAARDEERLAPAGLDRRSDQAELETTEAIQSPQSLDDVLERLDPVAEPGRLLVALALGEVCKLFPEARQRPALEQAVDLRVRARRERARGQGRLPPRADRPQQACRFRDDELVAAAPQVDTLLPAASA